MIRGTERFMPTGHVERGCGEKALRNEEDLLGQGHPKKGAS